MKNTDLRAFYIELIALILLIAVFALPIRCQETFQITTTLHAPEPEGDAEFGNSVAVNGDIIVVGEPHSDTDGVLGAGRAYIFDSAGNLQASLQAQEPQIDAGFGVSVAVSGNIIVIGESLANIEDIEGAGRAYIYDTAGTLQATLHAPELVTGAWFGWSVAVSEDIIVIGEYYTKVGSVEGAGKAYIYDTTGILQATLHAPEPEAGGWFGWPVAVSGDIILIGASDADVEGIFDAGRAYIFDTIGNFRTSLHAPEPDAIAHFVYSVAVNEDIVVIGEPYADLEDTRYVGRVYIFDTSGNLQLHIQSPESEEYAKFSESLAVNGDILVVNEPHAKVEGISGAGKT